MTATVKIATTVTFTDENGDDIVLQSSNTRNVGPEHEGGIVNIAADTQGTTLKDFTAGNIGAFDVMAFQLVSGDADSVYVEPSVDPSTNDQKLRLYFGEAGNMIVLLTDDSYDDTAVGADVIAKIKVGNDSADSAAKIRWLAMTEVNT